MKTYSYFVRDNFFGQGYTGVQAAESRQEAVNKIQDTYSQELDCMPENVSVTITKESE